jgi:hypothetical protein
MNNGMRFSYLFHESAPPNPEMYSFATKYGLESLHVSLCEKLTDGLSKSVFEKFRHSIHYDLLSPQVYIGHCTKYPIYVFPE